MDLAEYQRHFSLYGRASGKADENYREGFLVTSFLAQLRVKMLAKTSYANILLITICGLSIQSKGEINLAFMINSILLYTEPIMSTIYVIFSRTTKTKKKKY